MEGANTRIFLIHECGHYDWVEFSPDRLSEHQRNRTRRACGVATVPGWDVDGKCSRCAPAFVRFTRRTDGLKLIWLEKRLSDNGIACRRNGYSFHAPVLLVEESRLEDAWNILRPVDDDDDDDPKFELDLLGEAFPWDLPEEE